MWYIINLMENINKDIVIIGGGPIGIYFAALCKAYKLTYALIEKTSVLGGQMMNLYPNKIVDNIPNCGPILAKDFINNLIENIDYKDIYLNQNVLNIIENEKNVEIICDRTSFNAKLCVLATGLGIAKPRKLDIKDHSSYSNILYNLKNPTLFKNKEIVILGGGNAALDWCKQLYDIASNITLVHRRNEFRGDINTIKDCHNIKVMTPYIVEDLIVENIKVKSIILKENENQINKEIKCDYILVNYGIELENNSFKIKKINEDAQNYCAIESESKRIVVIGDASNKDVNNRKIAPAIQDCNELIKDISYFINFSKEL